MLHCKDEAVLLNVQYMYKRPKSGVTKTTGKSSLDSKLLAIQDCSILIGHGDTTIETSLSPRRMALDLGRVSLRSTNALHLIAQYGKRRVFSSHQNDFYKLQAYDVMAIIKKKVNYM